MKKFISKTTLAIALTLLNFCLLSAPVFAASDEEIAQQPSASTIEIPVADYSDTERNKAFIAAFKQVVTNVSGNAANIKNPEVQKKLKNISSWVQSYNYTKHSDTTTQQKLFLQVRFDNSIIPDDIKQNSANTTTANNSDETQKQTINSDTDNAVQNAQIQEYNTTTPSTTSTIDTKTNIVNTNITATNTTNANAPTVLVWLVALGSDLQNNIFADDTSNNNITRSLKTAAKNSGIKITLPEMDLEDISQITADDVCNLDSKIIKAASKRYNGKITVAGCISGEKNNLHSEWLLFTNNKNFRWTLNAQDHNTLITQAFNKMAELLNVPAPKAQPLPTPFYEKNKINPPALRSIASPTNIAAQPIIAPQKITEPPTPAIVNNTNTTSNNIPSTANTTTDNTAISSPTATQQTPSSTELQPNQTMMSVTNVTDLTQYAAVVKYLRSFSQVTKIELQNINATEVQLKVTLNSDKNALVSALKPQHQLTPNDTSATDGNNNALSYNWQPPPSNPNT